MSLAPTFPGSLESYQPASGLRLRLAARLRLRRRRRARQRLVAMLSFRDPRMLEDVGVPEPCRIYGVFELLMPR